MLLMISKLFEVLEDELDLSKCFASKRNSSSGSESATSSWLGMATTPGVRESGPDDVTMGDMVCWKSAAVAVPCAGSVSAAWLSCDEAWETRLEITAADADMTEEGDDKPEETNVAAAATIDLVNMPSVKLVLRVGLMRLPGDPDCCSGIRMGWGASSAEVELDGRSVPFGGWPVPLE